MSTAQVGLSNGSLRLDTNTSSFRTSSNRDFPAHMRNTIGTAASIVGDVTKVAAPFVPGASVLSAALNHAAGNLFQSSNMDTNALTGGGVPGVSDFSSRNGAPTQENFMQSVENLQQNTMQMNAYMLALQNRFQGMNMKFSTLSNILRLSHDTKKNSVSNIR